MDPSEIAVALARIEAGIGSVRLELGGKLDLLNAQAVTLASRSDDHEHRIREIAAVLPERLDERLRALEGQSVVTPRALMGALTAVSLIVGTAAPFLFVVWS